MFVKEYGPLIERLIDAQNEGDAFDLVKEAMNHYNGVINDAFPVIPEKDIPFILASLELFYNSIMGSRTEEEQEVLTELVELLASITHVHVCVTTLRTETPMTEAAARELHEEQKRQRDAR